MKKNVASQLIGVQMTTAADGTAFTGTVTVVITIDGGTQSASGGTGPTHEGNGYHSYIPTQAETNGDIIAFTFTGTGAITATVQVFTTFPQTADHTAGIADIPTVSELNARTLVAASYATSAEMATAQADLDKITGTNGTTLATLQPNYAPNKIAPPVATDIRNWIGMSVASFDTDIAALPTATEIVDGVWDENLTLHTTGSSAGRVLGDVPTASENRAEMDSSSTQLAAIVNDTDVTIPALIAALNNPTAAAIADAVWDEVQAGHVTAGTFGLFLDDAISSVSGGGGFDPSSDTVDGVTWDKMMQAIMAVLLGRATVSSNTISYKARDGSTEVVSVTVDGSTAGKRDASTIT